MLVIRITSSVFGVIQENTDVGKERQMIHLLYRGHERTMLLNAVQDCKYILGFLNNIFPLSYFMGRTQYTIHNTKDMKINCWCYQWGFQSIEVNLVIQFWRSQILYTDFFFSLPRLWHAEVPKPGVKPTPQQRPEPLQWQCQILNPLCHKKTPLLLFQKSYCREFLSWLSVTNLTRIHKDEGLIPGLARGLRIWCCRDLWCWSQMWLGSHVAVAVV